MKNNNKTNYTNVTLNLIQSLFKFNKLGNSETCQGLRHWRLLSNLKNNFLKPVRNDMKKKILNQSWIIGGSACSTQPSPRRASLLPKSAVQDDRVVVVQNDVINKNVKTLVPQCLSAIEPKKKVAFTLAEVLITLGIIGIVAAMTIPTLITNYQKKQTVTKLQKAISILNQAYRLAYDDVGEATAEEAHSMGAKAYYNKYWAPYIKTSFVCQENTFCGYDRNQPFYAIGGTEEYPLAVKTSDSRVAFQTLDGFFYMVITYTGEGDTSAKTIVDINGPEKPNILGRDVFLLERKEDGEKGGVVVPYCSNSSTSDVIANCTQDSSGNKYLGMCCAERIRRAGWEIDKSYPWN